MADNLVDKEFQNSGNLNYSNSSSYLSSFCKSLSFVFAYKKIFAFIIFILIIVYYYRKSFTKLCSSRLLKNNKNTFNKELNYIILDNYGNPVKISTEFWNKLKLENDKLYIDDKSYESLEYYKTSNQRVNNKINRNKDFQNVFPVVHKHQDFTIEDDDSEQSNIKIHDLTNSEMRDINESLL